MNSLSFGKLNQFVTQAVMDATFRGKDVQVAAAESQLPQLTDDEMSLLTSLKEAIEEFSAKNPTEDEAAFWAIGVLVSCFGLLTTRDEWTLGFFSIPMIRHRKDSQGEEWTLRFASIPMIRHPKGSQK